MKVQQRAVRQGSGLTSTVYEDYEDRLRELSLPTLEERRRQGQADMKMVHKILQGEGGLKPGT